jgi:L-lysine 6-transaminase
VTREVEEDVRAAEERALDQVRKAFDEHGDDVASIIIEPIQAEGGDNHFRAEFLQALQRLARDNECLFIVDEVQTGIAMTGKMWAYEHFGITPDVIAFGKKVQVGGCMAGPRMDEEPQNVFQVPSRINSTWGGGLTDMVRCGRYLEVIDEDRLVDNARVVGEHLLRGLQAVQAELGGLMTNARGRGLMIAFDLPSPEARDRAHKRLIGDGLLLLTCGTRSIRFRPPLNLTAAEADSALEIVRTSLRRI